MWYIVARLTRTYGGTPDYWLKAPMRIVRNMFEQIQRVEAEEALRDITTTAVGAGSVKRGVARDIIAKLQRLAERKHDTIETKDALPVLQTVFAVVKEPTNG